MKKNSFRIECRRLLGWTVFATITATIAACSDDPGLNGSAGGEIESGWIEGAVDPNQSWATAVSVQLDIESDREADITAQTILDQKVTILGKKHIKGSNVMFVDVPQGIGTSFGLVYDDGSEVKQYKRINLSGMSSQLVDVDFRGSSTKALTRSSDTRAATNESLYGKSYIQDCGYFNFGSWAWDAVAKAVPESQDAKKNMSALLDYEMKADGSLLPGGEFKADEEIYISFLYGCTGTTDSRVLGYYYHSGDYSDIVFQDIAETITLDYLNGKAKVQYQLDGKNVWYDANFNYKDSPSNSNEATDPKRRGDDAYNTLEVNKAYGDRITAVRGLTFKLDIPQGKKFGFYLRNSSGLNANQKTALSNLGVPNDRMPKYTTNFSNAKMNINTNSYRSTIAIYDSFTFMGLDDNHNGGDYDCNDVTFAISNAKGEKYKPTFTEETLESNYNKNAIEKNPEYKEPGDSYDSSTGNGSAGPAEEQWQSWTVAMENSGMANDFDFNDVVIKITPNTANQTCALSLLAAGAHNTTEIYYDNKLLGEVHKIFNVEPHTIVNTRETEANISPVDLGNVSWTEETIDKNLDKFMLKAYNDDGTLRDIIKYGEKLGKNKDIPQGLCVMGDWEWPLERERVNVTYPLLGHWAININLPEYWNWYSMPVAGKTVKSKKKK